MSIDPKTIKHIHLVGICGTGMGSLACLLKERGYHVSGSDTTFYPPMGDQLKKYDVEIYEGYSPENLKKRPDFIVIGNVIPRTNPEAKAVLESGIPYNSLPATLSQFFLKDKKPLVVVGTHGKTTTSTLLTWILTEAGLDPSYFIGGIGINLEKSAHLGSGDYFVVEGDEYDCAFFDKRPKFVHFKPHGAIWTSIEWDHIDIYPSFEKVKEAFALFLNNLHSESKLFYWKESPIIEELLQKHNPAGTRFSYGLNQGDYQAKDIEEGSEGTKFLLTHQEKTYPMHWEQTGLHNLENALAVIGLCKQIGLTNQEISRGLSTFKGIKRRQEVVGIEKSVTVIDDFAHHPTAVKRTLQGIQKKYPGKRIWAIFEPRSNTSRRNIHYKEYLKAFKGCDRVILAPPYKAEKIPTEEILDTEELANDLWKQGIEAYAISKTEYIVEFLLRGLSFDNVLVFMSNGSFGNIHQEVLYRLSRRKLFEDKKSVRSIKVKK